ncbi:MAG: UDP-4-amino-4,6-dideoxy-N-acetyl-beta-L-altrosamine transaminase [Elusimicrobiota bacterium]|jgi:UDP-4-amino-4,6-dideoxy-N-acetyl-beta-L-altrosamine transaminase|nr:UDP-4-amino-4,6-dideoxy-N-acetyl-beta-L-altrosamine transaminase [Elusimicrobiota bacterium]
MKKLTINGGRSPVRKNKIGYGKQFIDDEDIKAVVDVLQGDLITCGPKVSELEHKLCNLTGAKYAVVLANGTAALHVACLAGKIKPEDEVITTPMTFAASANCVLYCGSKPIFADINPETYNIDPDDIERKINKNTKAVIAVDFTGQAVELARIMDICRKHNLLLIEDAAHSIGTKYNGKPIGSIADMTTFSFHPVKTVTGGEGGAILTNSKEYYDKLMLYRTHGIAKNSSQMIYPTGELWYYEQVDLGYNYRLTDFQAALISSQLNKLDKFSYRRKEIVQNYDEAFSKVPEIIIQKEIPESDTTRHLYIIRLRLDMLNATRKQIFDALYAENIGCNVHYIPVYWHPYYQKLGYKKGLCSNAEKLYEEIISIPLYYSMTDEDVDGVIEAVNKVTDYYRKE